MTIDTLRADHMSLYGYERQTTPEIERWFGDGLIYERSYSTEASTSPSVASILSGLLPQEHGVRLFYQLLPDDVHILPDLLPPSYQTAAVVSNMVLTDEAIGLADRFDHYDDYVYQKESVRPVFERDARATTDAALTFLREEASPGRPLFLWVHYIDPHGPYSPPEDWEIPFEPDPPRPIDPKKIPEYTREPGIVDGNEYVRQYDGEIAFTDAHVGRLLDGFAALRPIEDALLVLTSDHGESMMEHERWFTHGYHVYEEIVRVPLALKAPGIGPARVDIPVSGIDVATTILSHAGATPPPGLAGTDLLQPQELSPERIVFTEASDMQRQQRAALSEHEKWIVTVTDDGIAHQRVYRLDRDADELNPLKQGDEDLLDALQELIAADPDPFGLPGEFEPGRRLKAPKVAPTATPEQLERLKGLGYTE